MKAIILNSGLGKRMGSLTNNKPKCLVELVNKETILYRQLSLLKKCNIKDIIVTTGPYKEKIINYVNKYFSDLNIKYIHNPLYNRTNYIFSIYLIKEDLIDDDILLMHGDLVFEEKILKTVLDSKAINTVVVNKEAPLPEKDFKGRVINDRVKEIGIDIFDSCCLLLMPLYKFNKDDFILWLNIIEKFINNNSYNVYAENALNQILNEVVLNCTYFDKELCSEIDTLEDINMVNNKLKRLKKD